MWILFRHTTHVNNDDRQCSSNSLCSLSTSKSSQPRINLLSHCKSTVLFFTAINEVKGKIGEFSKAGSILDSASQSNFISSKCANRLGLSIHNFSGLTQKDFFSSARCNLLGKTFRQRLSRGQFRLNSQFRLHSQFQDLIQFAFFL